MDEKIITQTELVLNYFIQHAGEEVSHPDVVDWVTEEYKRLTGKVLRDPDRQIRSLHQKGQLIKVRKGVYKYDPNRVKDEDNEEFSEVQKKEILKRGEYKCAVCGRGPNEGYELHVDHIQPRALGGKADISNGQVLCSMHNMRKKKYRQTETGKRMFINLYALAKANGDNELMKFIEDIIEVYDEHQINGHIVWEKDKS